MDKFPVIILNWNGADDTIECVRSILRSDPRALPVVVDNGSADDSVARMMEAFSGDHLDVACGSVEEMNGRAALALQASVVLVRGRENLGFAGGCNLGLRLVSAWGMVTSVFLNNDTVVEHAALTGLVEHLVSDPRWFATLPQLTVHGTDRIWNCGGRISSLGFRRYFFAGAPRAETTLPPEIVCSFFTGCCFAVRTSEFMARGGFSESFFFGEEDFELSLWMKDNKLKALCLTDRIVHHKVSASSTRAAGKRQASKVYVHYLNRFIHMRHRFGRFRWTLWLMLYLPYVVALFVVKKVIPAGEIPSYLGSVLRRAARSDAVTREDFESIMKVAPW